MMLVDVDIGGCMYSETHASLDGWKRDLSQKVYLASVKGGERQGGWQRAPSVEGGSGNEWGSPLSPPIPPIGVKISV